jgi:peptidoglycan hydrolase-like protein with peptidoglycan-binding domain
MDYTGGRRRRGPRLRVQAAGVCNGSVDGIYGPQTVAAVKQLQDRQRLANDGRMVDPATPAALGPSDRESSDRREAWRIRGVSAAVVSGYRRSSGSSQSSVSPRAASSGTSSITVREINIRTVTITISATVPRTTGSGCPPTSEVEVNRYRRRCAASVKLDNIGHRRHCRDLTHRNGRRAGCMGGAGQLLRVGDALRGAAPRGRRRPLS